MSTTATLIVTDLGNGYHGVESDGVKLGVIIERSDRGDFMVQTMNAPAGYCEIHTFTATVRDGADWLATFPASIGNRPVTR